MATQALAGKTATVQIGTGGPPPTTWDDIEEVYEIGELPIERDRYDVTSHGESYYREYILGLFTTSELTMAANYVQSQYDSLFTEVGTGNLVWYRIAYPDNTSHEFEAIVSSVSPVTPLDDRLTYNLTLTVSGPITRGTVTP